MKTGWVTRRLGDIFEIERGGSPRPIDSFLTDAPDGINWIKIGDTKNVTKYITKTAEKIKPEGAKRSRIVYEGDFILSNSMSFGRPYIMKTTGCIHDGWLVLREREQNINQDYLYYVLGADVVFRQFDRLAAGSTVRNLNIGLVQRVEIPVPPLPEQRRIVSILDGALEGIAAARANTEENIQSERTLFENYLDLAVQGKLLTGASEDKSVAELVSQIERLQGSITKSRTGNRSAQVADDGTFPPFKVPANWNWVSLDQLTVGISDGVHAKPNYQKTGIPFVTVKNLTAGPGISFDDVNFITREDHNEFIKRTHPERGDILITKDGTIGVVRVIDTDAEFSIFVSLALVKPAMPDLTPYLTYLLRAPCIQSQIVPKGAALKHLYLADLRRLAVPVPPLGEQSRIVQKLDALDEQMQRLESVYRRKLAALDALKQSLLHQAFVGAL